MASPRPAPPCEKQEVLGELRKAVAFVPDRAQGAFQLFPLAGTLEGELDLCPKVGEWSPQLVARVGDEAALPFQGRLEPAQHLVERLAEACQLVTRGRDGETAESRLAEISAAALWPPTSDRVMACAGA